MKRKFVWPWEVVKALREIQFDVSHNFDVILVNLELNMPNGQTHRASPHHFGKSWHCFSFLQWLRDMRSKFGLPASTVLLIHPLHSSVK